VFALEDDFSLLRSERRSFFCPNKLWVELEAQTGDCMSVSTFIRQAIIEKMVREAPEKRAFFESLL
jgi:hypothetical protein